MKRLVEILVAGGCAALLLAAPASAATIIANPQSLEAGPVFAGSDVVWVDRDLDFTTFVLNRVQPGQAPVEAARIAAPPVGGNPVFSFVSLAASASHVAVARSDTEVVFRKRHGKEFSTPRPAVSALLAGPVPGPLTTVATPPDCSKGSNVGFAQPQVALSGSTLVWPESSGFCPKRSRRFLQQDLSAPAPPQAVPVAGARDSFAAAGDYIAFSPAGKPGRVAVANRSTGQVLYSVRGFLNGLDLQEDGTVAGTVFDPDPDKHRILSFRPAWASVADPVLHVIPHKTYDEVVRIANNRIAYTQPVKGTKVKQQLAVSDLAGHSTPIARLGSSGIGNPSWDISPTQIVWGKVGRREASIQRADLP